MDEEFIVFDPDLELEWELDQAGREVVFTPEPSVSRVTAFRMNIYWWAWFHWHDRFDWCLCRCEFCERRLVHAATCEGDSRIRKRA